MAGGCYYYEENIEKLYKTFKFEYLEYDKKNYETDKVGTRPSGESLLPAALQQRIECVWIKNYIENHNKDLALRCLCANKNNIPDLPILLWNTYGMFTKFVFDISCAFLYTSNINKHFPHWERVSNILDLINRMSRDDGIRNNLINSKFHTFVLPIIKSTSPTAQFECLRLNCLQIICSFIRFDLDETASMTLVEEFEPLCVSQIKKSDYPIKIASLLIIEKIIFYDRGMDYMFNCLDRYVNLFKTICTVCKNMKQRPVFPFLKCVIRCFVKFVSNEKVSKHFVDNCPEYFLDGTFEEAVKHEKTTAINLRNLVKVVMERRNQMNVHFPQLKTDSI